MSSEAPDASKEDSYQAKVTKMCKALEEEDGEIMLLLDQHMTQSLRQLPPA